MLSTLLPNYKLDKSIAIKAIPMVLVALGGYIALADYLLYNFHLILGLIVLVASVRIDHSQRSWRYLIPIFVCFGILIFIKISFAYYLAWICCLLALTEMTYGKTNLAPFFAFMFISPLFEYFKIVFGFPLRIALTDTVVHVMNHFFDGITSAGNLIYFEGEPFYIDEACAGLNTLGFAIALTLILLGFQERKTQRHLRFVSYVFILASGVALVIFSNAVRIALLIIFKIPAETAMHEIYGLVVIFTHIVLPLYVLTNQLPKFDRLFKASKSSTLANSSFWTWSLVILCLGFGIRNLVYKPNFTDTSFTPPQNYTVTTARFGVTKLQNEQALVYIKPPVKPFQLEHSPTVCWVGSGYKFTEIKESVIHNRTIYTGLLQNKNDLLYTAWWFDSGANKTIDPIEWRLDGLKTGAQYRLINVTASTELELINELKNWL